MMSIKNYVLCDEMQILEDNLEMPSILYTVYCTV
jgi:hypothetical protein